MISTDLALKDFRLRVARDVHMDALECVGVMIRYDAKLVEDGSNEHAVLVVKSVMRHTRFSPSC